MRFSKVYQRNSGVTRETQACRNVDCDFYGKFYIRRKELGMFFVDRKKKFDSEGSEFRIHAIKKTLL